MHLSLFISGKANQTLSDSGIALGMICFLVSSLDYARSNVNKGLCYAGLC